MNALKNKNMKNARISFYAMNWRNNPKNKRDYKYYKNIGICKRWQGKNGFKNFYSDMGNRPKNHTLERINNLKKYSPKNCKWATRSEQAKNTKLYHNKRNNKVFQECEKLGLRYDSIMERSRRKNVSPEKSLEIFKSGKTNQFTGITKVCKQIGADYYTIKNRMKKGMSLKEAKNDYLKWKKRKD